MRNCELKRAIAGVSLVTLILIIVFVALAVSLTTRYDIVTRTALACPDEPAPYYGSTGTSDFKIYWNGQDITVKTIYFAYDAGNTMLSNYGPFTGNVTDQDTHYVWNTTLDCYEGSSSADVSWSKTFQDVATTTASTYTATENFQDDYNPSDTGNPTPPGSPNSNDGLHSSSGSVKLLAVGIGPQLNYLAVGSTTTLTASITPSVSGGPYSWTADGHFCFIVNNQEQNTATGPSVVVKGKTASTNLNDASVSVNYPAGPDDLSRTVNVGRTMNFTAFQVDIRSTTYTVELNWNDNNTNNKSDRRDSGVPNDSTKVVYADPNMATITLDILPASIAEGTSTLSLSGEADRAAIWASNDRTGDRIVSNKSYSNSTLEKNLYFEAIYPTSLGNNDDRIASVTLKLESTLGGSKSEKTINIHQYLYANNTWYTTPHEDEYSTSTAPLEVHLYDDDDDTTTVHVNTSFKLDVGDVSEEGYGLMRNAIIINNKMYEYLGWTQAAGYFISDIVRTAYENNELIEGVSTAKLTLSGQGGAAISALDRPSDIYIPQLSERILAGNVNLDWLANNINEHRQIDDSGNPKHELPDPVQKWIDIHLQYIPPSSRSHYQDKTMVQILTYYMGAVQTSNLKVDWIE